MFPAATTPADPVSSFAAANSFGGHVDPAHVFQPDNPARSPGVAMMRESMFAFGADSDVDDEDGGAFPDRNMSMLSPDGMDDSAFDASAVQRDPSLPGRLDAQTARYPAGPPRKQVTIGGTTTDYVESNGDWESGNLGRSQ
jgi:GATA-binding protein